jgi:hypothetical protein
MTFLFGCLLLITFAFVACWAKENLKQANGEKNNDGD